MAFEWEEERMVIAKDEFIEGDPLAHSLNDKDKRSKNRRMVEDGLMTEAYPRWDSREKVKSIWGEMIKKYGNR